MEFNEIEEEREVIQPEEKWRYEEILSDTTETVFDVSEDDEDEAESFEFVEQTIDI